MNQDNQINGIPNVNDIQVNETPAESFENLYGNNGNAPQSGMQPNPAMMQQPTAPNPMEMQPNPGMMQQPTAPNPMEMQPNPGMMQQPTAPNPMEMQPNPAMMQQPTAPNSGTIIMPESGQMTGDITVDIDADRMQSIEEQLSKTSQYNPEDLQQEKITIPTDNQYEKNKSGLAFVIVLFIILALVIVFLPQITKFFS